MADCPIQDAAPAGNTDRCGSCRYFLQRSSYTYDRGVFISGICRFNPPTAYGLLDCEGTVWPVVSGDDWCGKYESVR